MSVSRELCIYRFYTVFHRSFPHLTMRDIAKDVEGVVLCTILSSQKNLKDICQLFVHRPFNRLQTNKGGFFLEAINETNLIFNLHTNECHWDDYEAALSVSSNDSLSHLPFRSLSSRQWNLYQRRWKSTQRATRCTSVMGQAWKCNPRIYSDINCAIPRDWWLLNFMDSVGDKLKFVLVDYYMEVFYHRDLGLLDFALQNFVVKGFWILKFEGLDSV